MSMGEKVMTYSFWISIIGKLFRIGTSAGLGTLVSVILWMQAMRPAPVLNWSRENMDLVGRFASKWSRESSSNDPVT